MRAGSRGSAEGPIVDLTCRHWAGKKPFCIEERLINLSATPEAADEHFAEVAPGLLAARPRALDERRTPHSRATRRRAPRRAA